MNNLHHYTDEQCLKIFNSVTNPHWRIWKTKDEDGICRQNKFPINSPRKLKRFIKRCKNPQALYFSISQFLNPHKNHGFFANQKASSKNRYHYPREGYLTADCILLDTFYFIDIDHKTDLRIVQEDGRKIIKELGYPQEIRFSGTKGIHLVYSQQIPEEPNSIKRINCVKAQKKSMTNQLINLKLKTLDKTHQAILNDPFRVIAAPYSIKGKGGIVHPIPIEDFLNKDIYDIVAHKCITKASEAVKADDSKVATAGRKTPATQLYRGIGRAGLSSYPIFFKFVDNMVSGLKNTYITVIKKHNKKFRVQELMNLQKQKNLSDFIIYSLGNYTYAINLKLQDFDGEAKILKKIKSDNLQFFMRRKHAPIPLTSSKYENKHLAEELCFMGVLSSNYGQKHYHSKPHADILGLNYRNTAGIENKIGLMRVS
jgi:hypothetical protein